MSSALEGTRVLDATWALSGPFGTMILCDLGAEVIKVEGPQGDRARENQPWVNGTSLYFFSINRGKKSIVIDLKSAKGKEIFLRLVSEVDVVTENFTPGTMDNLGLGYETLRKHNPRLIYAACSGFGQTGSYATKPALDVIAQGMGGIMSITGEENGPPVRVGASIGDISAGLFFCIGILAALREREKTGQGQMVDVSLLDCQAAILENAFVRYFGTGEVPQRIGTRHPVLEPFQAYPTKDGRMVVAAGGGIEQWAMFLEKIGRLDLLSDERFHDRGTRYKYHKELEPIISEALKAKTTKEWIQEFESFALPCGPLNSIAEAAEDPQLLSRNMFVDLPCPSIKEGKIRVSNTPIKFSKTPSRLEKGAPLLGEHTVEVLSTLLGMRQEEIEKLEQEKIIGVAKPEMGS